MASGSWRGMGPRVRIGRVTPYLALLGQRVRLCTVLGRLSFHLVLKCVEAHIKEGSAGQPKGVGRLGGSTSWPDFAERACSFLALWDIV